jgi:uncharacterized protein YkwD
MSPSPASAGALACSTAERRRPLTVLLVTFALVLTALVLPQSAARAGAATAPRYTAATASSYARAMLSLLNRERHAHGKRPLKMAYRLRLSAHRHNLHMAARNIMSHQLPGEPFFATRISNAGYHWSAAGENIGWNSQMNQAGLLALERQMYNEKPPDNGHRLNILSSTFTQVGIDVLFDRKHHKIWFTQDFAKPA